MSASPYASDKAAWWKLHWAKLRDGLIPPPVHVQLILSDLCNEDCNFCAYRMSGYTSNQHFADEEGNNNPKRMIPRAKAFEIIRDCADMGVRAIQFTGGGEPTVHPDHDLIMEEALSLGMKIGLVTNGTRLVDGVYSPLTRATWIRVSLDAGTAETYAKTRRSSESMFRHVLDNIERLAHNGPHVELGVGFVVTPDNWLEVADAARLAKNRGADNFRISAMFSPDGKEPFEKLARPCAELIAGAKSDLVDAEFKIHDMFTDRLDDLEEGRPDYGRCSYQHFTTYIGGDLNIYRCCVTSYNDLGFLGTIKDKTFRQLWESPELKELLLDFNAGACGVCQFNNKNRTMLPWWTEPPPEIAEPSHAAFV